MYVDRSGQDPFLAVGGLIGGGVWGLATGLINGDSGGNLWRDIGSGAVVGGLAV